MTDQANGQMNGHTLEDATEPQDTVSIAPQQALSPSAIQQMKLLDQQLEQFLTPVFQTVVNGSIVSNNMVQPDTVIRKVCEVMGKVVGACLCIDQGNMIALLATRNQCKKSFADAIGTVPIRRPQHAPQPQGKPPGQPGA